MTLVVHDLSCIRQERQIFSNLSLSLSKGELLWVKGRNGAGKSSLLRVLANLLPSPTGRIEWMGEDIVEEPALYLQNIRYVGHQDGLKTVFTPRENLQFWVDYMGAGDVEAALDALELQTIADSPVRILSAGQKKRTQLAKLLATPARLWILDEPISSLDVHFIDLFRQILTKHIAAGGMALLATHQDLEIAGTQVLDLDALRGSNA